MIWAYGGSGLRTTISVETYWKGVLNNIFGKISQAIPIGEIIFFLILAFLMWLFFRTKSGLSMSAVGKMKNLHKQQVSMQIKVESNLL